MCIRNPSAGGPLLLAAAFPIATATLLVAACGEGAAGSVGVPRSADGGAFDGSAEPPRWANARPVTRKVDATSPLAEAGVPAPVDAPPVPACVPGPEPDIPDDDFQDTNCDGIDGDAVSTVFVAPGGSDEGDGTREAPLKTLGTAVARARELGKRAVYACVGVYEEQLELSEPITIHGGFDCERGWSRIHDLAFVRPTQGTALRITKGKDIALHWMAFQSGKAAESGESSIAVVVTDSQGIAFDRSEMAAGEGGRGKAGKAASSEWAPVPVAAPGKDGAAGGSCLANRSCTALAGPSVTEPACSIDSIGGSGPRTRCPDGSEVQGGRGGRGGNCGLGLSSEKGADGMPAAGGDGDGRTGSTGPSGKPGGKFGHVVNGAYVPASGTPGGWGSPGTAGRGGDGAYGGSSGDQYRHFTIGGGGGQGGYPGCGGTGGEGGGGGGASIALLVERSDVTVTASRLITGRGGDGGEPARGGSGQPGGIGARGAIVGFDADGAPGRKGGDGGQGGAGGPGGGGPSIGVVHVGDAPRIDEATSFDVGEPGAGAVGATVAPDGLRAETYAVPVWGVRR